MFSFITPNRQPTSRVVSAAVPAAVAALISILVAGPTRADDYAKTYSIAKRASVHVSTDEASVRIITDDAKQVEFHVEYSGFVLDKTLHIESHQSGDDVKLTARITAGTVWPSGSLHRVHIEVHMPKDADLQVEAGDGAVEAAFLSGTVSLKTEDGSIQADHVSGTLDVCSSDGSIRLAGRFDGLKVRSADGSIHARAETGSHIGESWDLSSSDGSIDLALPHDFAADLDATTDDGTLKVDFSATAVQSSSGTQIRAKLNGGGQLLRIHTGDGSIRVEGV